VPRAGGYINDGGVINLSACDCCSRSCLIPNFVSLNARIRTRNVQVEADGQGGCDGSRQPERHSDHDDQDQHDLFKEVESYLKSHEKGAAPLDFQRPCLLATESSSKSWRTASDCSGAPLG